jgi:hypothetical protein
MFRYAAVAVLVALAFLGLSNAQIQWDRNGLSFRMSLRAPVILASNYPTKEELERILYRAMNETEQSNYQMMLRMLDTIDRERADEMHMLTRQIKESRNKN